jgi:uncharacterized protein YjeT (DUF2065 family)
MTLYRHGFFLGDHKSVEFWQVLPAALALVFVIEGILPFLSPARWRAIMMTVARLDDSSLRRFGLVSMVFGVLLLYLVN